MDSEQFSLIFSTVCCFISVTSAVVSGVYCFEVHKDSQVYKEEAAKKKREEEIRKLMDELRQG